jgi:hypothetical protein
VRVVKVQIAKKLPSGAKEAAEKRVVSGAMDEERPSGAEAHGYFAAFAARLKSCPFKTTAHPEFSRSL